MRRGNEPLSWVWVEYPHAIEYLRLEVAAWIAHVDGRDPAAAELMREAAQLEATTPKHPVTPAPTLPASELLGDLLMELDRPADALDAYRSALDLAPNRLNSLVGAAHAAEAAGRPTEAAPYRDQLREQLILDSPRSAIQETVRLEPPPATQRPHRPRTARSEARRRHRHHHPRPPTKSKSKSNLNSILEPL